MWFFPYTSLGNRHTWCVSLSPAAQSILPPQSFPTCTTILGTMGSFPRHFSCLWSIAFSPVSSSSWLSLLLSLPNYWNPMCELNHLYCCYLGVALLAAFLLHFIFHLVVSAGAEVAFLGQDSSGSFWWVNIVSDINLLKYICTIWMKSVN